VNAARVNGRAVRWHASHRTNPYTSRISLGAAEVLSANIPKKFDFGTSTQFGAKGEQSAQFPCGGLSVCGIECVSLGDVNEVEQRAANAKDRRDGVGTLLKRHRAGGDFVQAVINRTGLAHIGQWHVNRDRAVAASRHLAVRGRQLGDAGICQGHASADYLLGVFAGKAL
jgi:hypothetical protein